MPPKKKSATRKKAAAKPKKKKKSAEMKTKPTAKSVTAFINAVENETRKKDAKTVLALMKRVTGEKPTMWGPSIVGFGSYHYVYPSGREGDMCIVGFSPRKTSLVLYVLGSRETEILLPKLGKHKRGVGCLYINKLEDVDMDILEKLVATSFEETKNRWDA